MATELVFLNECCFGALAPGAKGRTLTRTATANHNQVIVISSLQHTILQSIHSLSCAGEANFLFQPQLFPKLPNRALGLCLWAGIINDPIGFLSFFIKRHLGSEPCLNTLLREIIALGQALFLYVLWYPDDNDSEKNGFKLVFVEQGYAVNAMIFALVTTFFDMFLKG